MRSGMSIREQGIEGKEWLQLQGNASVQLDTKIHFILYIINKVIIRYRIVSDIESFIYTDNDFSELERYQGCEYIFK